jgi:hypothetical protein
MANDPTPREKIVAEFIRRMNVKFNDVPVERGTLLSTLETVPKIFIFMDATIVDRHKRMQYIKTLPITIEYAFKGDENPNIKNEEGDKKILEVRQAIELDEWVIQDGTTTNIVIDLKQTEEDVLIYPEDIIDVIVGYELQYVDNQLGIPAY